jgi:hypothetical protein
MDAPRRRRCSRLKTIILARCGAALIHEACLRGCNLPRSRPPLVEVAR